MAAGGGVGDEWYVVRAQSGRVDAFEELVRRHQVRVYRIVLRLVGDPDTAEEVAQDVFVQAWRSLPAFRRTSSFSTWLYRITVTRSLNARRSRCGVEGSPDLEAPSAATGPDVAAEAHAEVRALRQVVIGLLPDQRAVFVLRDLEGYSYDDIGAIVGKGLPAVKSLLYRARLEVARGMAAWK